jgi:hypothetical protein
MNTNLESRQSYSNLGGLTQQNKTLMSQKNLAEEISKDKRIVSGMHILKSSIEKLVDFKS